MDKIELPPANQEKHYSQEVTPAAQEYTVDMSQYGGVLRSAFRTKVWKVEELDRPWYYSLFSSDYEIPNVQELAFPLRRKGPEMLKWFDKKKH